MDVYLTIFDAASMRATQGRFGHIAEYIDDLHVQRSPYLRRNRWERPYAEDWSATLDEASDGAVPPGYGAPAAPSAPSAPMAARDSAPTCARPESARVSAKASGVPKAKAPKASKESREGVIARLLKRLDAPFSTTLMRMIDERGLKDSEVYKRANMSRQHFSKIRSNRRYQPKKQTVLALCVALELNLDETRLLLERAGFALSHADERDVIVEYFISRGNYDIYDINLALYAFDQPLLG